MSSDYDLINFKTINFPAGQAPPFSAVSKDLLAFGVVLVRRMTAATAAITLACLLIEMLCYVLERLHSSGVLSTKIGLHK